MTRVKKITIRLWPVTAALVAGALAWQFHGRADLTSEKRYTLSEVTRNLLDTLPQNVFVRLYFDGEMPLPLRKMQTRIIETLEEYKTRAHGKLAYTLINPYDEKDKPARDKLFEYLYKQGLHPVNVQTGTKEGGASEQMIFPGAIVVAGDRQMSITFLKNNPLLSSETNINQSLQTLEYELTNAIRNLASDRAEKIAFLEGHGELNEYQVADVSSALSEYYQIDRGRLDGKPGILDGYKAVVIAGPLREFSEADKFVLDQYLMQGGRIAWFLDPVFINADSLANGQTLALGQDLGINDQLFRYGIRVNPVLVKDFQCGLIPVNMAIAGEPAKFMPVPWPYSPLAMPADHPLVRGLNMVKFDFASTVDTLTTATRVRHSVLLQSSGYSATLAPPVLISLAEVQKQPVPADFPLANLPLAVLSEGVFSSVFANRPVPATIPGVHTKALAQSRPTRMLVVADADVIRNEYTIKTNGPSIMPAGYDRVTRQTFGNRNFVLNAINYLTDDIGMMELRSREFKLKLLDRARLDNQLIWWQLANVAGPVVLTALCAVVMFYLRRKRYGKV